MHEPYLNICIGRLTFRGSEQLQLLLNPQKSAGAEGGVNSLPYRKIPNCLVEKVRVWLR